MQDAFNASLLNGNKFINVKYDVHVRVRDRSGILPEERRQI